MRYTESMGGERASTSRMRLAGKICAMCHCLLPQPNTPGEKLCDKCHAERRPMRRIYMYFMLSGGWHCQFLEADLKTPLPKKLNFSDIAKVTQLIERGNGFRDLEMRNMFEHAVQNGRGGVYLELTEEQYQTLKSLKKGGK